MATVRGCNFPEGLHYDVPRHVWYADAGEGLVRLGITPVGLRLAREVIIFTPKRVGRYFEADRGIAVLESAKWVGSVRAGFPGTVEAVNEKLATNASALNRDCYGEGWLMLVRPETEDWRDVLSSDPVDAYSAWMEENGFPGCGAGA